MHSLQPCSTLTSCILYEMTFVSSRRQRGDIAINIPTHHDLRLTDKSLLLVTNNRARQMKLHVWLFCHEREHTIFEQVFINQKFNIDTKKRIIIAPIGAEHAGITDILMLKCSANQIGYIKYSDGICYRFYCLSNIELSCDNDSRGPESGGLRGPGSIYTVVRWWWRWFHMIIHRKDSFHLKNVSWIKGKHILKRITLSSFSVSFVLYKSLVGAI